jgi:hypothetical protein
MTTRLPAPPRPLPTLRPSDVFPVPTGSWIGRLYFTGGAHPTAWDSFRAFGPVASMRFDHQPPPPAVHPTRAIAYAAPRDGRKRATFDPLAVCVRECFATTNTIDTRAGAPWFVLYRTARVLRLLDVVDSPWISRAGGNGAISSGMRGMARRWSRAIYHDYSDIDGIFYEAATLPAARSVALYERATNAVPFSPKITLPLEHPGLRAALKRIAYTYGMDLVL